MSVTPEDLAAFADGELEPQRAAEVAAAVATDPALAEQVRAHRALKARLAAHFAPILEQPLPERLTAPLRPTPQVVDLATERARRRPVMRRLAWIAGPALAASLALMVVIDREPRTPAGYAGTELAALLDDQLVATQPADAPTRILLSFRDEGGAFCRAFAGEAHSGIACRDATGWRLRTTGAGVRAQVGDYRMAGNPAAEALERAQAMAAGPALDAAQEQAARASGWR